MVPAFREGRDTGQTVARWAGMPVKIAVSDAAAGRL
jgi:hypothetical protein